MTSQQKPKLHQPRNPNVKAQRPKPSKIHRGPKIRPASAPVVEQKRLPVSAPKRKSAAGDAAHESDAHLAELIADVLETEAGIAAARRSRSKQQSASGPAAPTPATSQPAAPPPRFVTLPGTPEKEREPASPGDGALRVTVIKGETEQEVMARLGLNAAMQNTFLAKIFTEGKGDPQVGKLVGDLDITACAEVTVQSLERLNRGSLQEAKQMLFSQATALQSIFTEMARRSAINMGSHLGATETYLRLALRAQAQAAQRWRPWPRS
jgi:hypothetical protein